MPKKWQSNLQDVSQENELWLKKNNIKRGIRQNEPLTSEALFPSGLMTAMGLSGCLIRWPDAKAATACWLIAFNVGWLALLTTAAKSLAVGDPCVLRYSFSCLFCFCAMK